MLCYYAESVLQSRYSLLLSSWNFFVLTVRKWIVIIVINLILISTLACGVEANVTAPNLDIVTSSSSLFNPNDKITVTKEILQFSCSRLDCEVTASYFVTSDIDVSVKLEFITGMQQKSAGSVTVRNGKTEVSLTRMSARRTFDASLKKGENVIEIKYPHEISEALVQPSHFNSYRVRYITYDLWPLKDWKLSDSFTMDVKFYYKQPAVGILGNIFGATYEQVSINAWNDKTSMDDIAAPRSLSIDVLSKGYEGAGVYFLRWEKVFDKDFPDRLLFYFAPAEEVKHFIQSGRWERVH